MNLDIMLIIANRDKERRERERDEAGRRLPLYDDDRGQIPEPRTPKEFVYDM